MADPNTLGASGDASPVGGESADPADSAGSGNAVSRMQSGDALVPVGQEVGDAPNSADTDAVSFPERPTTALEFVVHALESRAMAALAADPVVAAYAAWLSAPPALPLVSPLSDAAERAVTSAAQRVGAKRGYRDVAVLGYAAAWRPGDSRVLAALGDGLAWLRGRRFFAANQPLGFEADGVALLGVAVGVMAMDDPTSRDSDGKWLATLLQQSLTLTQGADEWDRSLLYAALLVAERPGRGEGETPSALHSATLASRQLTPDLAAALAAKRLLSLSAEEELGVLQRIVTPHVTTVSPERAVTQRAALRWLMRQGATALPRRASVADVVAILSAVPHALKRWPWEDKPKTSRAGAKLQRWDIQNEYHVQSLLWMILSPLFPDLEDEEYLQSLGHKHPRVDLAIPSLGLIIEVKYLREGTQSAFSGVVNEVSADTGLYLSIPSEFTQMVAFVWDDARSNNHHTEMLSGLRLLNGVADAVVVSRPGGWEPRS